MPQDRCCRKVETEVQKARKLIVFDVEGVLLPKKRYLFFELGRNLRFADFVKIIFFGFLYEVGLIPLKPALQRVFRLFKGFRAEALLKIFRQMPLMPGAENLFAKLKQQGWHVALISSGLPTLVVKDLAQRLGGDYAFGFEFEEEDGRLTGKIWGNVLEQGGKLPVLRRILELASALPSECVMVADDRNNAPILLPEMLKIGYNPDFVVRIKADRVVNGDLMEITPLLDGKPELRKSSLSRNEIRREAIHACGFLVPIISYFIRIRFTVLLIVTVTLLFVMSELARMERRNLPVISSVTKSAALQPELFEFATAPIFFAFGILLTLLLFPSSVSYGAIAIFALGDSAASIFGKIFGKRILPFNKGKTLEGSILGFIFAFLGGAFWLSVPLALVGAAVAMITESLPLPLNDNVVTPLVTGLVLVLLRF
ncbi:MAG: HAD-IB family phosphatase [Candidatus Bathyarchaeota archaeon]|nr:HAD-IB family phosphatase [Candidatus Bathyarchaeota archaeon]